MPVEIAIIRRAREIISDPERWTTGASARNADGRNVSCLSSEACCWCASGALELAAYELRAGSDAANRVFGRLRPMALYGRITATNDAQGHAAVLSLFDKALALEVSP